MNIGDRVRVVHGKEEGIITRILDSKTVEVNIDNDFPIPLLISELVLVSQKESQLKKTEVSNTEKSALDKKSSLGVFLALVPIENNKLELHLINNSELKLFFAISETEKSGYKGLHSGVVNYKKHQFCGTYKKNDFSSTKKWVIQYFLHDDVFLSELTLKSLVINIKDTNFLKNKENAPLLGVDSFLFRLDEKAEKIDTAELIDKIFEDQPKKQIISPKNENVEVDLHIEMINPFHLQLLPSEKLKFQLDTFEKELNKAIVAGLDEIVFIHGVGAGVLKNEIAKILSGHPNVEFYKDAQKDKFGYGATMVKLK